MLPFVLAAALIVAAAGPAWSAAPSIADCDRLTAHPEDDERVRSGVPFSALDGESAYFACETALAAHPESPRLRYQYARALEKIGDLDGALKQYRQLADKDYAAAQYALGLIFARSKVMPFGQLKAARWFRLAAEASHAGAQFRLALMYQGGHGVRRDESEAQRWLRAAAARGLARAQFNLGRAYERGLGVEPDKEQAAAWYREAAAQGYGRASFALAALETEAADVTPALSDVEAGVLARPSQEKSAEESAARAFDPAAPRPVPQGQQGQQGPRGPAVATASAGAPMATAAAPPPDMSDAGIADAMSAGLAAYHAGNYESAAETWMPLAEHGVRRAEFYVGGLFMEGRGVDADKALAYYWLKRSTMNGYPAAKPLLVELTSKMSAEEMRRGEELITARPARERP